MGGIEGGHDERFKSEGEAVWTVKIKGRGKEIRNREEEKDIHGNLLSSGQVWNNKQK